MKFKVLLTLSLMAIQGMSWAQRNCGSMDHLHHLIEQDPKIAERRAEIESQTARIIQEQIRDKGTQAVTYTIPVVVHVVYRTAAENISDAQVQSQIAVLNEDFQLLNADNVNVPSLFAPLKANVQINFCLAQRDPSGVATTGITRTVTTRTSFGTNDAVKSASTNGKAAWSTSSYLNLWVCNIGGGILGYAQFPGGPAATDGVVIDYRYFGRNGTAVAPFNKGRTATHEVGHWLNLYHIWGDDGTACTGSDLVADTPNQADENYGCPSYPTASCSNTSDMYMNYMDYTDDACMYMFSTGQSDRMRALFATGGARASLLNSTGCNPPSTTCNVPTGLGSSAITTSSATVSWVAVSGATSYNLQYKTSAASSFTTVNTTSPSYSLTGLSAATAYVFQVQTVCSSGSSAYSSQASFTTSTVQSCGVPTGLSASGIGNTAATLSWAAVSGATSYNLQYKTSAASTFTTVNTTSTSRSLSGLVAGTAYVAQVQAVCSSGSSSYSSQIGFSTTSGSVSYCASKGNSQVDEWIDRVSFGGIVRTSGKDAGYLYYTTASASVSAGTSYSLGYSAAFTSTAYTEYWRVYIDWNQNGVFTDAGEQVVSRSSSSAANLSTTITVPATAKNGTTRMRVVMKYGAYGTSCETFSYGEVEDYNVVVTGGVARESGENKPSEGTLSIDELQIFPNPAHERIYLNLSELSDFEVGTAVLVDMKGRVILEEILKAPNNNLVKGEIETGNLPNGLYNLIISTEKGRTSKKVIILHP